MPPPQHVSECLPFDVAASDRRVVATAKFKRFAISSAVALSFIGTVGANPICTGDKKIPPIYLYQANDESLFTLDVITPRLDGYATSIASAHSNRYEIKKRAVDAGETRKLCELGFSVSVLDIDLDVPRNSAKRSPDNRKFEPVSHLEPAFTIGTAYIPGYGQHSYGNFWVPASMPSGHYNQWSAFDVVATSFETATPGTHFIHSVMWDTTYPTVSWNNGKGVIAAPYANACTSGFAPTAVMESWSPAPSTKVWGPVPGWGATPLQDSCSFQFYDGVSYGFVTGANNVSQWQSYSQYYSGSSSPFYSQALNTYQSSFLTTAAGVAFFVGGPPPSTGQSWSLSFTGVASGTY